ncbi:MAG: hypothetical protein NZ958_04615 [Bacteroidia bacterium]|nr:hypothetical protein [Bacteroidia bacterium]MDW8089489.1 DUF3617 family protein [Bacteroidia bacterium]
MLNGRLLALALIAILVGCKGGESSQPREASASSSETASEPVRWIRPGRWRFQMKMPYLGDVGTIPSFELCINDSQAQGAAPLSTSPTPSAPTDCKFERLKLEKGHFAFRLNCPEGKTEADYRSYGDKVEGKIIQLDANGKEVSRIELTAERIGDC